MMMRMMMIWGMVMVLVVWVWRTLDWVWWTPKRLERELRQQGLYGNHYRILHGDLKDNVRLLTEAKNRPMALHSHDIAPRVVPLYHNGINDHGKISFTWFGPHPRVSLMDPRLIKQVLSNKFGHFVKPKVNPLAKILLVGVLSYDGQKWAKHRRIINPAFHLDKLKLMVPAFSTSCGELIRRWENMMIPDEDPLELDVSPELQNLTKDVISWTAFGSNYEEGRRIFQFLAEQTQLFLQAIQSVYIPGYQFLPTPMNKRRSQIDKEMGIILSSMIEKREKAMRMGEGTKNDLLGILLESNMKMGGEEHGKSNNRGMTTEDVIDECKLFYFSGQEIFIFENILLLEYFTQI